MFYTSEYLQFGSNKDRVPGYEDDLELNNKPFAPIPKKLANPNNSDLWDLVFSYESGGFYPATAKVPGVDGATIQSWYNKEGIGPGGDDALVLTPFILDEVGGGGGFAQASHFVDFSQPTPTDNAIDTDTIATASVTATVHQELPVYAKLSITSHANSHSIVMTTTTTHAVFDKIFVYAGNNIPIGNTLTVNKGQTCLALAVFKLTSSSSSKEISTRQYPKIPKSEWPMIISELVNEIIINEKGQVYEHLSPRSIAGLDQETLKSAISSISHRIENLGKIQTVMAGIGEKLGK